MRTTATSSALAAAISCVLAFMAITGCGDGARKADVDMAALNASLAVREGALSERLDRLAPDKVEHARRSVSDWVSVGEKTVAELPPDDCEAMSALATALGHFRNGCEALVAEVIEAANAGSAARLACGNELASLKRTAADLTRNDIRDFIADFAENCRTKETQLSGWRKQRLEKLENLETATFPAFAAAEAEHFSDWEDWSGKAEAMQRTILEELFPQASAAASNMVVRAADAVREHGRATATLANLRSIPVDAALVDAARNRALEVFDGIVLEAIDAIYEWTGDENDFIVSSRKRAKACGNRAETLEKESSAFANAHPDFFSQQNRQDAQTAVATANGRSARILLTVKDFEDGMIRLQDMGATLAETVESARKSAAVIRHMTQTEEEVLAGGIADIEALRLKVEKFGAINLREAINEKRKTVQTSLVEMENALAEGEQNFAEAKTKSIEAERAAKWKAEKNRMRESLTEIKMSLERAPNPGYVRPERETKALLEIVARLLVRMDSMAEDELRAAVIKVQADHKEIEANTKWTIGTRHPDRPHIFASNENGKDVWNCDPGYAWVEPNSYNLDCHWSPGRRHPDHPHISAGQTEGTWVPDPGYKERWRGDLDPVWTPGMRHPTKPHIFAATENGKNVWNADPGYWFDNPGENSDLMVSWRPGRRHPDHPHISAGQTEGTWVPDPGYKERWRGDLDPVWTVGVRHPHRPHVFASTENGKNVWDCDPGYVWVEPGSHNLDCFWKPGRNHPDYKGIVSAQQEGKWNLLPGWTWVNPGTSDLRTRWVPKTRHPNWPHVFASNETSVWSHDPGYEWASSDKTDFSVRWVPGMRHPDYEGIEAARQDGRWSLCPGWAWVNPGTSDLRTRWTPGARHPDKPHIHASIEKWKWDADEGYEFVQPGTSNLDVVKKSRTRPPTRRQPQSVPIYKRPISDFIPDY